MAQNRKRRKHGRTEDAQGLDRPVDDRLIGQVGNEPRSADGSGTESAAEKGVEPELLAFEDGIRSRLGGPQDEMNAWLLFSPFARARILAQARRFRSLGDVEDIVSDTMVILLRLLNRPSSPLLGWDRKRVGGFWPTVFGWKVQKAVETALRRRNQRRQVVTDPLACDRAEARADRIPAELWGDVMAAMASLPARLRVVVRLHYLEGYSCRQLEKVLGIERHIVARRLKAGVEELRRLLNSHF